MSGSKGTIPIELISKALRAMSWILSKYAGDLHAIPMQDFMRVVIRTRLAVMENAKVPNLPPLPKAAQVTFCSCQPHPKPKGNDIKEAAAPLQLAYINNNTGEL